MLAIRYWPIQLPLAVLLACSNAPEEPRLLHYPPLASSAYCPGYDPVRDPSCSSLTARRRYVSELAAMEYKQITEFECSLENPETPERRLFECGKLLFGLAEGVEEEELQRVLKLTDGILTRFPSGPFDFGSLDVPIGTEVEAIGRIIFNPDLLYVEFNTSGGVAF